MFKNFLNLNGQSNYLIKLIPKVINSDFRTNYIYKNLNLINYNLCLLLNFNVRLENPLLNAKLRQEYLWNNLQIYSFNNNYNLTYNYIQLGNSIKSFLKFINGTHWFNQIFIKEKINPLLLISQNLLHRKDNIYFFNLFKILFQLKRILNLIICVIFLHKPEH